ncbi:hypothetical protein BDV98DRAFT_574785, partial [Pterulicium gracile]
MERWKSVLIDAKDCECMTIVPESFCPKCGDEDADLSGEEEVVEQALGLVYQPCELPCAVAVCSKMAYLQSPSREEQGSSHEHADRSDEESLLGGEESDLDDEYDSEESIESITESDRFFPADMSQPNPDIFPRHAPRFSSTSTCDAVTFADRTVSNPSRPSSSLRSH